jgi:hypothetical protein
MGVDEEAGACARAENPAEIGNAVMPAKTCLRDIICCFPFISALSTSVIPKVSR